MKRAPVWSLQDAKNRLSEVVNAAGGEPQTITKHGKRVAVVVDAEKFDQMNGHIGAKRPTLNELLLAIPQAPDDEEEDIFQSLPFREKPDVEL
jgi:prevent-host-death family protein